jgi:radical SAM superfamily enzyme YgiQ (UPF0313 family)
MFKVLLINPPIREGEPPRHIPTGLAIIASVLRNEGYKVSVLDINAERIGPEEVEKRLDKFSSYDIVGIGGLITTYRYIKQLMPKIKQHVPKAKIILGGGVVTENPTLLLSKTDADIAVVGEGEITLVELFKVLENDGDVKDVLGICYKKGGKIIQTGKRMLITKLDSLPFPAWDLFPMDIYLNNVSTSDLIGIKTEINILASRGCSNNCNYCYHIFGRGPRFRSVDNIIAEMKELKEKYGVESFTILDDTFTIIKERILEFCQKYIESGIGLPWSCYARVNQVDTEMIKAMKRAGCFWIGYGIESGSQKILNNMNKGVTVEHAEEAVWLTRNLGVYCNTTFMFGYPGETLETIKESVDFCKKNMIKTTFFLTTPYPGTVLYEQVKDRILKKYGKEEKFIEVLGDATEFTVNLTDFSDELLLKLKESSEKEIARNIFLNLPKTFVIFYRQLGLNVFSKLLLSRAIGTVRKYF